MDTKTATTRATEQRYQVEHELGRGGMAVVFAARDVELERRVALKVLADHLAGDPPFRTRFMREARIAGSLLHPNLVRVYDVTEVRGLPCIVMELLEGGTLADGRLTLEEGARVADGLAYAHGRGIVHRDVKPGNLLRSGSGEVKLADFGIAHAVEDTRLTQVGSVLGTLRYLSPEQAQGGDVGPPADVYSLGIVLDELLDERPPPVRVLLDRCREPDPALRPTAAELAAALRGETVPLGAPARAHHVQRRRAPLVAAVAVLVAGVAVGLGLVATGGSSPKPKPAAVAPVPRSADAARQASALVAWLERYSAAP
jgi:hypothetical protein